MTSYISACNAAKQVRQDDVDELATSVLERACRVLRERDSIGFEFYVPQNNDTRDEVLLHFDNLLQHVAGAFDAEALLAYRAYQLSSQSKPKPQERAAGFRLNRNGMHTLKRPA